MGETSNHNYGIFQMRAGHLSQLEQISGEQNVSVRYEAERHICYSGSVLGAAERML